jgi:hypothetical protein
MAVQKQPKFDEGVPRKWQTLRDLSALPIIQVLRIGGIVDLTTGGHYHSRSSAGIIVSESSPASSTPYCT